MNRSALPLVWGLYALVSLAFKPIALQAFRHCFERYALPFSDSTHWQVMPWLLDQLTAPARKHTVAACCSSGSTST